jgi:hypothetical protein
MDTSEPMQLPYNNHNPFSQQEITLPVNFSSKESKARLATKFHVLQICRVVWYHNTCNNLTQGMNKNFTGSTCRLLCGVKEI